MKLDSTTVKSIERHLAEEIAACDEYLKVLALEQDSVIKLQPDKVSALVEKRDQLCERLGIARLKRTELVQKLSGRENTTLTELVTSSTGPADKKRLLQSIDRLKLRVSQIEGKSREFTQIVNFSL